MKEKEGFCTPDHIYMYINMTQAQTMLSSHDLISPICILYLTAIIWIYLIYKSISIAFFHYLTLWLATVGFEDTDFN